MKKLNFFNKNSIKLKILGSGEIKIKLDITAHFASKQAQEKITKAGGKLKVKNIISEVDPKMPSKKTQACAKNTVNVKKTDSPNLSVSKTMPKAKRAG